MEVTLGQDAGSENERESMEWSPVFVLGASLGMDTSLQMDASPAVDVSLGMESHFEFAQRISPQSQHKTHY